MRVHESPWEAMRGGVQERELSLETRSCYDSPWEAMRGGVQESELCLETRSCHESPWELVFCESWWSSYLWNKCTKGCDSLCHHRIALCLTRNVRFTCRGVVYCFNMKSKRSNFLLGNNAVDRATNPFDEVSITALNAAFTSHFIIRSQDYKFTAFLMF